MKKPNGWILTGIALALVTFSGCASKTEAPQKPPATVVAREITRRTVRAELTLTGTIEPERSARLAAQVDGEVIALNAREGAVVRRGQVLLRIDPSRLAAALQEAQADSMAARAQLEDGRRVLERDRTLFERQGISKERLEKSETDVTRLESAAAKARARVAGLEAQVADTEVKAPFDGYVLERSVELGDVVKNGTPLFVVASRSLHALVSVSQKPLAALAEGSGVRLGIDAVGPECAASIRRIRPRIDPATRTADLEIVPAPGPCAIRWLPGMLVRATFTLAERKGVLAAPAEAVPLRPDGSRSLFVLEGNLARQRSVQTGLEGGGWIEILQGIQEGESIIVRGFEKLKDGVPVSLAGKKHGKDASKAKDGKTKGAA